MSTPDRAKPHVMRSYIGGWIVFYTPPWTGKAMRRRFATWDEAIGFALGRCQ